MPKPNPVQENASASNTWKLKENASGSSTCTLKENASARRSTSDLPQTKRIKRNPPSICPDLEIVTFISHDKNKSRHDGWEHHDVRHFWDPQGRGTRHDGRNPVVWERLVHNHQKEFATLCGKVKKTLGDGDSFTIINFFCNWGKHRSVACAHLFGMIMKELYPMVNVDVDHKSLNKCKCQGCNQAGRVLPKFILDIFERASDI
jgi:hypothetical protein